MERCLMGGASPLTRPTLEEMTLEVLVMVPMDTLEAVVVVMTVVIVVTATVVSTTVVVVVMTGGGSSGYGGGGLRAVAGQNRYDNRIMG